MEKIIKKQVVFQVYFFSTFLLLRNEMKVGCNLVRVFNELNKHAHDAVQNIIQASKLNIVNLFIYVL